MITKSLLTSAFFLTREKKNPPEKIFRFLPEKFKNCPRKNLEKCPRRKNCAREKNCKIPPEKKKKPPQEKNQKSARENSQVPEKKIKYKKYLVWILYAFSATALNVYFFVFPLLFSLCEFVSCLRVCATCAFWVVCALCVYACFPESVRFKVSWVEFGVMCLWVGMWLWYLCFVELGFKCSKTRQQENKYQRNRYAFQ